MTSPDFRTFVDTLVPNHKHWLTLNPNPPGTEWFNHYVGDAQNTQGLLWQYEAWRAEHGYTRVRPWNGSEALDRTPTTNIPFPGRVVPYAALAASAGPAMDGRLAQGQTTTQLQASFGTGAGGIDTLGTAIRTQWNPPRTPAGTRVGTQTFLTPGFNNGDNSEIADDTTAPYSIRFWGFMKWASILRNTLQGIPVFPIPIVFDADGVPLSDIEFMDEFNLWHRSWHLAPSVCTQTTSQSTHNPFSPNDSPFGQVCSKTSSPGEFLTFHRDVIGTYNSWRQRAGMPRTETYRPSILHFHETTLSNGNHLNEVDLDTNPTKEYTQIKDFMRHFYTIQDLSNYLEGNIHGAGHLSPENPDITDVASNNYSPRFFGWHRWIDRIWEIRQPRFDNFRFVASDGSDVPEALTVVHPPVGADQIQPNNTLTNITPQGQGSLWIKYQVREETYGRPVNLTITAQVYRDSTDLTPVATLDATPIPVNPVQQGTESAPVELRFNGVVAGQGAFATQSLPGGGVGFKNGRIRIMGHLTAVGNIAGSLASGNDTIDYHEFIDIILVKENTPPVVSTLLNRSAFSLDEITVKAAGTAQSDFDDAFFVVVQDPPAPSLQFDTASIFADPARSTVSGISTDLNFAPSVSVVDATNNPINGVAATLVDAFKEQPTLSDNVSQRVLFRYRMTFTVATITALLPNPGDARFVRLQISARDRSGNTVSGVLSPQIKIFRGAHPYMIDVLGQNPYWLSIDTRVFSVRDNESRFGQQVSGNPNQYIKDVVTEFNKNTQNFDTLPTDENQVPLELVPQVNGVNVYNFALARVRMRTQALVKDVRLFFRLFTTAVSNLSFTPTNYPTGGATPIALLGVANPGAEIVSIPFFAEPRVETRASAPGAKQMTEQPDPANVQDFDVTPPGGETIRYFGAYLDFNVDTPRYPAAPSGNGPFPAADCISIRNILRGQHQCMVAEVYFPSDPTDPNSTPATSDHLAQRNLLIIESANPGEGTTHTAQHSFDIVLPDRRERDLIGENVRLQLLNQRMQQEQLARTSVQHAARHTPLAAIALTPQGTTTAMMTQAPLARTFPGFDELVFFWNNLPRTAHVEVYLPSLEVEYIQALRASRHAPRTIHVVDEHTLALDVEGVTYLPIPQIGQERIAGLLTVTLPDGIRAGEVFRVDVLQIRAPLGIVLSGFRLAIPVRHAVDIFRRAIRVQDVFEERLRFTPPENRWYPIMTKQLDYLRRRATGLTEEAADECEDKDDEKEKRVRIILEKVRIREFFDADEEGPAHVRMLVRVTNGDGAKHITQLPARGTYKIPAHRRGYTIDVDKEIFRGTVVDSLTLEVFSTEIEEPKRTPFYRRSLKASTETFLGSHKPSHEQDKLEDVELEVWQLWYRIEEV